MLLFLLRVSHSCALKMSTKYNKIFVITKILQNPTKYKFFLGEKVLILEKDYLSLIYLVTSLIILFMKSLDVG